MKCPDVNQGDRNDMEDDATTRMGIGELNMFVSLMSPYRKVFESRVIFYRGKADQRWCYH